MALKKEGRGHFDHASANSSSSLPNIDINPEHRAIVNNFLARVQGTDESYSPEWIRESLRKAVLTMDTIVREPEAVIISTAFLKTLPLPELRSGYAEVIKHGLIRNSNYFESLKMQDWENQNWKDIIEISVAMKRDVVEKDPKEEGLRKILNFGHTVGHAVESFYLDTDKHLLHGEAIAVGMIAEAYLSKKLCGLSTVALDTITEFLLFVFDKIEIPAEALDNIAQLCFQDKKNEGQVINCSLLRRIGECDYNIPVSSEDIIESLNFYNELKK